MSNNYEKTIGPFATSPQKPRGRQAPKVSEVPITEKRSYYYNPEKEINKIWLIMVGIVIFVIVSVLGTFFLLVYDQIKEKDLYIKYSEMQDNYYKRVTELENKVYDQVYDQQIKIKDLENKLEMLRARNSYLK